MKIIRTYILKDFLAVTVFSLLVASMITLMGNMVQLADLIVRRGLSFFDAAKIFLYHAPVLLKYIIPLSFLFGVLLSMGRLVADNELTAIRTAGVSLNKILGIFLTIGAIFSLLFFIINDRVIPKYHYQYQSSRRTLLFRNLSSVIEPGIFLDNFRNYILYVSDKRDRKLRNVFIYELQEKDGRQGAGAVTYAREGEFIQEGDILKIKLENGFRDEVSSSNPEETYRLNFKIFFMDIPIERRQAGTIQKRPADMTMRQLHDKIAYLKQLGVEPHGEPMKLRMEIQERLSASFSIIVFIFLGFGISLAVKHRERSVNLLLAIICYACYNLLWVLGSALIEHRLIPAWLGMWMPNMVIAAAGLFLYKKYANIR